MNFSFVYLTARFFYVIQDFLRHWFSGSFIVISHETGMLFTRLERFFAFRITLRNIFQPLYGDHTVLGHIFGIIFRLLRLALGAGFYLVIFVLATALYLIWIAIPCYFIYWGFFSRL